VIAIEVRFLTGRYVASRFDDRSAPEWPPHPARLFSALVATLHEHEDPGNGARSALEWLEREGAPHVLASEAAPRRGGAVYVPENHTRVLADWSGQEERVAAARANLADKERTADAAAQRRARRAVEAAERRLEERVREVVADDGKYSPAAGKAAREMLPEHRGKQPRPFPAVTPVRPLVRYVWPHAAPDDGTRQGLSHLAGLVVRLGHSSTLVSCRLAPASGDGEASEGLDVWVPAEAGELTLRTISEGQLARLERAHARHQGVEPRSLPAEHQPYRRLEGSGGSEPARSLFGEWFVLRETAPEGGRRLGLKLTRAEDVTRAMRGALLHHADDPPPPVLSGHTPDGKPLDRPHVAFLALADLGSRYAAGSVLGAAILLPRAIDPADRQAVLRALGRWEQDGLRLTLGRAGVMSLERVVDADPRRTLDPDTWTRPSRRWATVTPVALDENPGDLSSREPKEAAQAAERAEAIVARACERVGLPLPLWVQVMRRSLFDAAPKAQAFTPYPSKGAGFKRVCVHVELRFAEPVAGPVVLGAGRYFGIGLCRPRGEGWA
jgi:CRISPR-associated protein Csb2